MEIVLKISLSVALGFAIITGLLAWLAEYIEDNGFINIEGYSDKARSISNIVGKIAVITLVLAVISFIVFVFTGIWSF